MEHGIDYKALGERIRHSRERKNWTQEQLAERCELSAAHVGHIERGTRIPSLDALFKIATSLDVTIDYLIINSFTSDDILLSNINAILRNEDKLNPKTFVTTIRALADKIDAS